MKNNFYKFNCIIIACFTLFVLSNFFVSNGDYSSLENRYLQGIPKLSFEKIADRSFMDEVENYSNDQLMFRDIFVKAKAKAEKILGKKENNGVYFAKDDYLIEKPTTVNNELIDKNIQSIKDFAQIERFDVSVCVIPQAFEILKDKLPKGVYNTKVLDTLNHISDSLKDTSVKNLNPTEVLKQHKDEYIFYRSDHHQTPEGSYIIYNALGELCGYTPLKADEFTTENVSGEFLGTTYSKGLLDIKKDTINIYKTDINTKATTEFYGENKENSSIFFPEHLEKKDKYSYFLDGNHGITVVKGGAGNGRKIALFKDSYAHSLATFLINNYESIHLIDMRYFMDDPMKYLAQNNIKEILFLYGTSTFMADETIQKIGEYANTSPYSHFGLVKECETVSDGYFQDAVFLGDSLTVGFQAYSGLNANFLCRTSMSVGGVFNKEDDGTSLIEKVKALNPKKIYVMLGVNEYIAMSNKDVVMDKFRRVIDALKADNPDSLIYIQSLLPVSKAEEERGKFSNEVIYNFNETLKQITEDKQVYFIDVYKAVTDNDGYLIGELTGDGIHLGAEGCKIWTDYLKKHAVVRGGDYAIDDGQASQFIQGEYDLKAIAEKIKETAVFEGDVGETSPQMLIKTHNINPEHIQNAYGVVGGGATAEEISLFEIKDASKADEVKKLLEEYINTRKKSVESYIPKEIPKLENAVIYSNNKFVALVIANDIGSARETLENGIKL